MWSCLYAHARHAIRGRKETCMHAFFEHALQVTTTTWQCLQNGTTTTIRIESGWWLTVTFGSVLEFGCDIYQQLNQCVCGKCLLLHSNRHFGAYHVCMYASVSERIQNVRKGHIRTDWQPWERLLEVECRDLGLMQVIIAMACSNSVCVNQCYFKISCGDSKERKGQNAIFQCPLHKSGDSWGIPYRQRAVCVEAQCP